MRDTNIRVGRYRRVGSNWLVVFAVVALMLALLPAGATATHAFVFVNDANGADDQPNQKDLTRHGVDTTHPTIDVTWNWDDTKWPGGNTGDACALFDTDTDTFANFAVCVTVGGNPAAQTGVSPRLYSCGDTKADRCTGSNPVAFNGAAPVTTCSASVVAGTNPFDGGPDTVAVCSIDPLDVGSGTFIDACSFPSQQPNSAPSDCITAGTAPPAVADLKLDKSVNNAAPDVGDAVVFTIVVTNDGPADATGVAVDDDLPSGYTYVSDDGAGAYVPGTGIWTIGALANGASATLKITAQVLATGDYTNYAQVAASDQNDPDSTPNDDSTTDDDDDTAATKPTPVADLSLNKSVDDPTPNVGDNVVFTIVVTNAGPSASTGSTVEDTLPAGYTYVSDDGGGDYVPGTGIWTVAALANGANDTLNITATVLAAGPYTNRAEIETANEKDPNSTPGNCPALPAAATEDDCGDATTTPSTGGGGGGGGGTTPPPPPPPPPPVVLASALIGDTVFEDLNGNGVLDSGEPGIAGVMLLLTQTGSGRAVGDVRNVITNLDGKYLFSALDAGTYTVAVAPDTVPAGLGATTPTSFAVTLAAGDSFLGADFGYWAPTVLAASPPETLPVTGVSTTQLAWMSVLMLALGALLLTSTNRRYREGFVGMETVPIVPVVTVMSEQELQEIPGIGPFLAAKIVAVQTELTTINDLLRIKGVGEATVAKLRAYFNH